jgi:hypothetical protein
MNQKVKDELSKVKKIKKEKEALAYIHPELADQHNDAGAALYKDGTLLFI